MAEKAYFVRHGQTDHNAQGRMTGQLDVPLNEEGVRQAEEAARALPDDISEIFCSDLERCRQTAEILNRDRNLPVTYDARLRERAFGTMTGTHWNEIGPDIREGEDTHTYDYTPHGGETADQVRTRLREALAEIREKASNTPLIVTHGGIIRMMHADHNGVIERVIKNAGMTEFELPKQPAERASM
jgi:2,3-bisphosphoglycerate-dependent phosphoglycerate mutase